MVYKANDNVLIKCNEDGIVTILNIKSIFIDNYYKRALLYGTTTNFWYNSNTLLYESILNIGVSYLTFDLDEIIMEKPLYILNISKKQFFSSFESINCL